MDFPPRPPPGMIAPPGYPPPMMVPMMPPRPPYAAQADPRLRLPPPPTPGGPNMGPPVTVFVGNITEKAQDAMIRHLLNTCGPVNSWKRVQGATGKLQAFGFCEFGNPDAALRAIRILHDWEIADKKLVVKVDAKTKDVLEEFKRKKRKALLGEEKDAKADQDNVSESEYVDGNMKKEDDLTRERIRSIIKEHSKDMNAYITEHKSSRSSRTSSRSIQGSDDQETRLTGPKESLDDVDLEDGKRDIIHREIDKFRETMKLREAEKEAEKQKREKEKENSRPRSRDKDSRSRDTSSNVRKQRGQDRRSRSPIRISISPEKRSSRSASRRVSRSRSRSRGRQRSRSREDRRSRSRRDSPIRERRDPKDVRREREIEEEDKERKRVERKAREKEASYQERLRKWESREAKMARYYDNDRMKDLRKKDDEDKEAKKLREFLEDYDDDRDDDKYYKGSKLERRLMDREREAAKDAEDRAREKEEIEELRVQVLNEGHADPNAELERRMAALDGRKLVELVDLVDNDALNPGGVSPPVHDDHTVPEVIPMDADIDDDVHMDDNNGHDHDMMEIEDIKEKSPSPEPAPKPLLQIQNPSKKKIDVRDVFNQDDDDHGLGKRKKLSLAPLPMTSTTDKDSSDSSGKNAAGAGKKGGAKVSSEDKRKHIKSIIDMIPTDKAALFEYNIDWDMVDNQLMEKRIRPWVNKKIAEYIGEPEPTLTDFICSKVLAGSAPKSVLDDVQMVLDEEAEVFVVKMWRLLIYEIENKKHKASGSNQPLQST